MALVCTETSQSGQTCNLLLNRVFNNMLCFSKEQFFITLKINNETN